MDELQKNGIRIDMTLLNIHVNRILCVYKAMYDEATSRLKADQLVDVFHENCFNAVGRVMGYLTLIRCMNLPREEDVRKAVRLVVPSLKNIIMHLSPSRFLYTFFALVRGIHPWTLHNRW